MPSTVGWEDVSFSVELQILVEHLLSMAVSVYFWTLDSVSLIHYTPCTRPTLPWLLKSGSVNFPTLFFLKAV